jgi:squalene-hopene/tetraprenyl-beta-curcumene cyclase
MPLRRRILFLLLALVAVVTSTAAADGPAAPADAEVRKSVARSLPFLEKAGLAWMQEKNCISCHTVSFMLWSHNVAHSRGIPVDATKLAEWTEWSAQQSLSHRDDNPVISGGKNDGAGLDTMSQLLVGRDAANSAGKWPELVSSTPALMIHIQEKDGRWKAGGQLPNLLRPAAEGDAITTRWAILALSSIETPDEATKQSIQKALAAVKDAAPGKSIEDTVTRLLVAHQLGRSDEAADCRNQLAKMQHADGGWSFLADGPSDAFATGQVLYALSKIAAQAHDDPTHDSIAKARRFLIGTQRDDGTWPVTGAGISNASTPQRKKKVEPIYRYWGTAWATIGLATSLPEMKPITGSRDN